MIYTKDNINGVRIKNVADSHDYWFTEDGKLNWKYNGKHETAWDMELSLKVLNDKEWSSHLGWYILGEGYHSDFQIFN